MTETVKVLIAIQARSNSTRFPQKIYQIIGRKMVIHHVLDQAKSAKTYVERSSHKKAIKCDVAILYPQDDKQVVSSCRSACNLLIEADTNDDNDVLSRYVKAIEITKSDYIVRLTSDCPLLLDFIISKHINTAVLNDLDYVSNVFPSVRFSFDGLDVEVISKRAMMWLKENATEKADKEHVTTLLINKMPPEFTYGFVTHKLDSSTMKLSLDTPEDLENIRKYYHDREHKLSLASKLFGRKNIYEI